MELKIPQKYLLEAISWTHSITTRRSSIPVLSNVLIEAMGSNMVRMATTDLNLWMDVQFPAEVIKEGVLTVHARTLYDIARNMPEDDVVLKSKEGEYRLTVSSGRTRYRLNGMPYEDFPQVPEPPEGQNFVLKSEILNRMIAQTSFSIGQDETRANITGAFLQGDGKIIRMVTTDRHRLSKTEYRVEEGEGLYNFEILLPQRTVTELKKMVEGDGGEVTCGLSGNMSFFKRMIPLVDDETMEVMMSSKLIAEEFPPYERAIPKSFKRKAIISRTAFLESLRRVSIIAEDHTSNVKFNFKNDTVGIDSDNPNLGEGRDEVDAVFEGQDIVVCFNGKYFIDIISVLESEEISVELNDDEDAAVIRDVSDVPAFLGIVMPMKV